MTPVEAARAMQANTGTGGQLRPEVHMASQFIEQLYNAAMVKALGATVLSGLQGNVNIPKRTSGASTEWIGESVTSATGGSLTTGDSIYTQVPLRFNSLRTSTVLSREILIQSSPDIENLTRADMAMAMALGLDLAAINGTGSGNEPEGLLTQAGVTDIELGTNGGPLTWLRAVQMIGAVRRNNAHNLPGQGFLGTATAWEHAMTQTKDAGSGRFILENDQIAGRRFETSEQLPSDLTKGSGTGLTALIYGAWSDLLIGEFGNLDMYVDSSSIIAQGAIRLTMIMSADVAVRHAESFSRINDLEPTAP